MYIAYDAGGTAETETEGLGFYSKAGGGANPTGGTQIMMLRGSGNVGIGTTSPNQKLHIKGNDDEYAVLEFEGRRSSGTRKDRKAFIGVGATGGNWGTDMYFRIRNSADETVTWDTNSQNVLYMNGSTTYLYTGNTERMTINSSGNVGIGTTSPTYKLHVNGDVKVENNLYLRGSGGYINYGEDGYLKFNGSGIHYWRFNWATGSYAELQFRNLAGDNNCVIKAKDYDDICDDRVKVNEKLIENATETLMKLRPQTYEQYGNMDCSGVAHPTAGLIAQEVHYQAPELRDYVMGYPSDISVNMIQDIDINSYDIQNDPDYEALGWGKSEVSLSLNRFIPYLIRSNQEQETKIVALETQLADVLQRLSNANI